MISGDRQIIFLWQIIVERVIKGPDVIQSYTYMFKWACEIAPTMSPERKSIRLSFLDCLSEQLLAGTVNKSGEWVPNNSIKKRITILHKSCSFFFFGQKKLRLNGITNALAACASRNFVNSEISTKCEKLANFIFEQTENWQNDVIAFLKEQVNKI